MPIHNVKGASDAVISLSSDRRSHAHKAILWIVVLLTSLSIALAQMVFAEEHPVVEDALASSLQNALDITFAQFDVMGCSAAVILPSGEIWLGVAGISHDDVPITTDMLFSIGSTTKNYITPLILQLAEEGTLSLDDPLSQWLPERPFIDSEITIRQILNQRSGLCNVTDSAELWDAVFEDPARVWLPAEILDVYVNEPCLPPDTDWHYSNTGFLLLGMVIEQATTATVSEELRTRFVEPLGLERTFFAVEEPFPDELPICHGWFDLDGDGSLDDVTPLRTAIYSAVWTSGAIFSTAADLAWWIDEVLRGDVLSQKSRNQMLVPYSIVPGSGGVGYGLSINLYGDEGISNTGRIFGYLSLFLHLPKQGATLVVLLNGDDALSLDAISSAITMVVMQHLGGD